MSYSRVLALDGPVYQATCNDVSITKKKVFVRAPFCA
jgi:hypothetical protein